MNLADLIPSARTQQARDRVPDPWPPTARTGHGRLIVGGVDLAPLARRFGTPLVAIDTANLRATCCAQQRSVPQAEIAYDGGSVRHPGMAHLSLDNGFSLVAHSGEDLAVAAAAGFPGERIVFDATGDAAACLGAAARAGVDRVVVDSLTGIAALAAVVRRPQPVLVQVDPVRAGRGLSIDTGDAIDAVRGVLARPGLELVGLQCRTELGDRCPTVMDRVIGFAATHRLRLSRLHVDVRWSAGAQEGLCDPVLVARQLAGAVADACHRADIRVPGLTFTLGGALIDSSSVSVYRAVSVVHRAHDTVVVVAGRPDRTLPSVVRHVQLIGRIGSPTTAQTTVVGLRGPAELVAGAVELSTDVRRGDLLAVPGGIAMGTATRSGPVKIVGVASGAALPLGRRTSLADSRE